MMKKSKEITERMEVWKFENLKIKSKVLIDFGFHLFTIGEAKRPEDFGPLDLLGHDPMVQISDLRHH